MSVVKLFFSDDKSVVSSSISVESDNQIKNRATMTSLIHIELRQSKSVRMTRSSILCHNLRKCACSNADCDYDKVISATRISNIGHHLQLHIHC